MSKHSRSIDTSTHLSLSLLSSQHQPVSGAAYRREGQQSEDSCSTFDCIAHTYRSKYVMFAACNLQTAYRGVWCWHLEGQSRKDGKMILLNKKRIFVYSQQIFEYLDKQKINKWLRFLSQSPRVGKIKYFKQKKCDCSKKSDYFGQNNIQ
jgi:hypothetical protein